MEHLRLCLILALVQNQIPVKARSSLKYIHLQSAHEGISALQNVVAEVMCITEEHKATMIEPCFINGRLELLEDGTDACRGVRLTQVYDRASILSVLPKVEDSNREQLMSLQTFTSVRRRFELDEQIILGPKRAIVIENNTQVLILRKVFINRLGVPNDCKARMRAGLRIHLDHIRFVKQLLSFFERQGLPRRYSAFHWRSSSGVKNGNYEACADLLIKSKTNLMSRNNTSVILLSDLASNLNSYGMWGEVGRAMKNEQSKLSAVGAMEKLKESNFLMTDRALSNPDRDFKAQLDYWNGTLVTYNFDTKCYVPYDSIFRAVWDMLLAKGAFQFSSCTKCSNRHRCLDCVRSKSNFAKLLLNLNREQALLLGEEPHSHKCWS